MSIQMKTIVIVLAWSFAFQIHAASVDGWTSAAVIKIDAAVKAKVNALFGNGSDNPPLRS